MKHVLYMHGGSGNHGCEAIVRTVCSLLGERATLYSNFPEEDLRYGVDAQCDVRAQGNLLKKGSPKHVVYKIGQLLTGKNDHYIRDSYRALLKERDAVCYSVGGDNYCYEAYPPKLAYLNRALNENSCKTVLFGCSIEPELLLRPDICADLRRYLLIVARESMTFDALKKADIGENIWLCPDTAFILEAETPALPAGFAEGNTVGVNVSPLIIRRESQPGIVLENYRGLIKHILDSTDMHIALIPHVVWAGNDDREPLRELHKEFRDTGRVVFVEDCACNQLKGVIARCRFFIGARTHATIAAYSSCVPTLVVGYSVKAKGLARDLFSESEHYVTPAQGFSRPDALVEAFDWLHAHEQESRAQLIARIPAYQRAIWETGRKMQEFVKAQG